MLPIRIVCLQNVCGDGAAFDDGSAVCRDEDRRLSKLLNIEEFRGCPVLLRSVVKDEVVLDGEFFEKPDYALGLRVLRELGSAKVGHGITG
jgi:hypothetical protein